MSTSAALHVAATHATLAASIKPAMSGSPALDEPAPLEARNQRSDAIAPTPAST